ncbi:hypothetical protein SPRG_13566 [Saprolegnia parasitica CBS 223.65]|uniref:Uncharacterized protein n=1 Tax=Saprolegnia parasitica (strain CBS 223.65) TaxID=695850 RepID=A0A067C3A1_SAPPC|nr:hypothetical protein SPRG_13566 [Saprolegnia parasitica CBS 223.65]KDO21267.1 hypothetical protein SPRG_13566 [Saprolegnia parasitica CBS 223.65]|eukprot:XP_012208011.1 hypothetical protein SPRG_13566 [Saprolegnia parasitica CBS 223.65]
MGLFTTCYRESSAIIVPAPRTLVDCICDVAAAKLEAKLGRSSVLPPQSLPRIRHKFIEPSRRSKSVVGGRKVPLLPHEIFDAKTDALYRNVLCAVPEDDRARCDHCEEALLFNKTASVVWIALTLVRRPRSPPSVETHL